jgi:hypothetical protein
MQSHSFDCSHTNSETENHGLKTAASSNFSFINHKTNHCTDQYYSIYATFVFKKEVKFHKLNILSPSSLSFLLWPLITPYLL